jgi:hypothetical protein
MQNNGLEQQIAGLPHQDMKELKALWQSYFNQPAPVFNKATLVQSWPTGCRKLNMAA